MKGVFIVCAWLACAVVATSCLDGGGGPAIPPFDPFGTDPAPVQGPENTGSSNEEPSSSGSSIPQLCARVCARIASCPNSAGDPSCATECATSTSAACEAEFKAFLACFAAAPMICTGNDIPCRDELDRTTNCSMANPTR